MSANLKTVIRFKGWVHPNLMARYAQENDIELVTVDPENVSQAWDVLGRAHVYQVTSSRDEVLQQFHVTEELLQKTPNLLCVSTGGAGFDTVNVAACTAAGVLVVNQSGGNARSVAEHAIGMMLDVSKRITEGDRRMRVEIGFPREDLMGHEISEKTLGIVGLGNIGRRVARIAQAFDMPVLAFDPYVDAETMVPFGATKVSFDEMLAQSDFVSMHCPRNEETEHMMDAAAFAKMKKGAIFVTTCRGGVHDEAALFDALQSGHLRGAGLDVWSPEPPPLDHPLFKLPNVVASFHTAGVTHEARAQMAQYAADQAIDVLRGRRPPRPINPEVWPQYAKRFAAILGQDPEPF